MSFLERGFEDFFIHTLENIVIDKDFGRINKRTPKAFTFRARVFIVFNRFGFYGRIDVVQHNFNMVVAVNVHLFYKQFDHK